MGQRLAYQEVKAVRIDPDTGQRTDAGLGEFGILLIKGPAVFPGYVVRGASGPELDASEKVFEGWLDTGDLGSIDAEGFIRLKGRAKDLIIRGGHNIDPAVIEDVLLTHPRVAAASAVGRPDPHSGEVPVAYVTLKAGSATESHELVAWAADRVPEPAAAPRQVFIVEALPLTDVGKPFKPELRRDATHRALTEALSTPGQAAPDWLETRLIDGSVVVEVAVEPSSDARRILDDHAVAWRTAPTLASEAMGG